MHHWISRASLGLYHLPTPPDFFELFTISETILWINQTVRRSCNSWRYLNLVPGRGPQVFLLLSFVVLFLRPIQLRVQYNCDSLPGRPSIRSMVIFVSIDFGDKSYTVSVERSGVPRCQGENLIKISHHNRAS